MSTGLLPGLAGPVPALCPEEYAVRCVNQADSAKTPARSLRIVLNLISPLDATPGHVATGGYGA
jgi:hypothetical protein